MECSYKNRSHLKTGNVYFRPKLKTAISLPVFNLFQWFRFYIRDFIWIINLTEKSKFEENCRYVDPKVYCNLKLLDFKPRWSLLETFEKSNFLSMLAFKIALILHLLKQK